MSTETPQKIFLSGKDTASFTCPKCHVSKEADVTRYKRIATSVNLKVKCSCGNEYSVMLERRKYYRKETNIPGKFGFFSLAGEDQKGSITIMDISKGGLKFKMATQPIFNKGDILEVEFILDNKDKTHIRKQVFVRNVKDSFVNVEFCSFDADDTGDKAIEYYLY